MRKIIGLLIFFILCFFIILGYFTIVEYNPKEEESLKITNKNSKKLDKKNIIITTWNIGYSGMGEEIDFFLDGGTRSTPTKEEIKKNINGIKKYLSNNNSDIFMLQEVDEISKRTRGFKLKNEIVKNFGNGTYSYAYNYINKFVPIPIKDPIGKVKGGVLLFSKYLYNEANRIPLPGSFSWPIRIFHLKRAMLEVRYKLDNNKELVLINTHNSAFDKGNMREAQMNFIKNKVISEYNHGNYVIVGGDWNMVFPNTNSIGVFEPEMPNIKKDFMPSNWILASDGNTPSVRYTGKPYDGTNSTRVIDGFLLSPNIELVNIQGINLNFKYSDHNPVKIEIKLKENLVINY